MAIKTSRRLIVEKIVDLLEAGRSVKDVSRILAAFLIENHQTRQAELYLRDIRVALMKRKSYLVVDVDSANELSDKLSEKIFEFMKKQTGAKDIEIINTVNPDLVNGVVISTTDTIYDASLKNRIKKLRMV